MVAPASGYSFFFQLSCSINFDVGVFIFPHFNRVMLRRPDLVHLPKKHGLWDRIEEMNYILLYSNLRIETV
jgi:hypothetical protein